MALAPATPPWIRIYHPDIAGSETYAYQTAYRQIWYFKGWRSVDDAYVPSESEELNPLIPGPSEMLPMGVSRAFPVSAWKQNGVLVYTGQFGEYRLTGLRAGYQAKAKWGEDSNLLGLYGMQRMNTDPLRVGFAGSLVSFDGEPIVGSYDVKIGFNIIPTPEGDLEDMINVIVAQFPITPVESGHPSPEQFDVLKAGISSQIDIEDFPVGASILEVTMDFVDRVTGDPIDPESLMSVMVLRLSMWEGSTDLVPRFDLAKSWPWIGSADITPRTVQLTAWPYPSSRLSITPTGVNFEALTPDMYGGITPIGSAAIFADVVGGDVIPTAERFASSAVPTTDDEVVRKLELDAALALVAALTVRVEALEAP